MFSKCRRVLSCALIAALFVALSSAGTLRAADKFAPTAQRRFVAPDARLEAVWDKGEFTEGPALAPDETILFSDIGNRIYRYHPASGQTTVYRENSGKANGLMFDRAGYLYACEGANGGNRRISITDPRGDVRTLADRYQGKRFNSPNDLALDSQGRVYFTDPRYVGNEPRELDFEGVFLIERDGTVRLATRDLQKPNGILVSADGRTVYVADNNGDPQGNHHLLAFRVQPDGTLNNKRILFDFGPNHRGIDGMTLDSEGNIYATAGSGEQAGVYIFGPEGKPLAFIQTPGAPTNCVFGARDERHWLYITAPVSRTEGTNERYGLFRIRLLSHG